MGCLGAVLDYITACHSYWQILIQTCDLAIQNSSPAQRLYHDIIGKPSTMLKLAVPAGLYTLQVSFLLLFPLLHVM